jgi:CBS domain-containing protein
MQTRTLVTVREGDDLATAHHLMKWRHVRHLPVVRGKRVVGILTERDLLRYRSEAPRVERAASGGSEARSSVKRYMSMPPVTIAPDAELTEACALMIGRDVGCLPVVDGGRLVGLVTASDVVALPLGDAPEIPAAGPTVDEGMRRDVLSITGEKPLLEAVALMADHGIRHLPVVDETQRVIGIVSDRDVRTALGDPMMALHSDREGVELLVSDVMSVDVKTVLHGTPLGQAAAHLAEEHIGALPVVDGGGRLVGILSYVDVIRSLSRLARLSAA